jgi:NAD(P)-dependent dehydrogenase (short-subunit alcohol dehydrogenase family)
MRLQNKEALLTGAAAATKGELMGFGGAAAHLFVREGAKVALSDILQRSGRAPGAARSHADGQARHRPGHRQWRAVPGV